MSVSKGLNTAANVLVVVIGVYLIVRPNGIGAGAMRWLRGGEDRASVSASWNEVVREGSIAYVGKPGGTVLIEFGDYECRYCARQNEFWARTLLEHPDVELRYIHLPLSIHPHAEGAARTALCAEEQGRFREMHRELFSEAHEWRERPDPPDWMAYAELANVSDLKVFEECLNSSRTVQRLERARDLARKLKISATPSLVHRRGIHRGTLSDSAFARLLGGR